MDKRVKVGIIACSNFAIRSILPLLNSSLLFELVTIGSEKNRVRSEEIAKKYNCNLDDYSGVIKRDDIEAVYISTPVGLHFKWAKEALLNGKHVLVEKTMTTTFKEAEELYHLAESKGLILLEGLAYYFHPIFKTIEKKISDGELGAIRLLDASFGFPQLSKSDIRYLPDIGGGAVLDNLIYPLSFAFFIMQKYPLSIHSNLISESEFKVNTRGFVQLNWEHVTANLSFGFDFSYRNEVLIWGDKAILKASRLFSPPPDFEGTVVIQEQDKKEEILVEKGNQFEKIFKQFFDFIKNRDSFLQAIQKVKFDTLLRMKAIDSIIRMNEELKSKKE